MNGIKIRCDKCRCFEDAGGIDEMDLPIGWVKTSAGKHLCAKCSGAHQPPESDAIKEAIEDLSESFDALIEAEVKTSKDVHRYTRIGKLANLALKASQLYSRRVKDFKGSVLACGDDDINEGVGALGAFDLGDYGGVNDAVDLTRQALMQAQRVTDNARPLHPVTEIKNLIEIRDNLADGDVSDIERRIEELRRELSPEPAKVEGKKTEDENGERPMLPAPLST